MVGGRVYPPSRSKANNQHINEDCIETFATPH